MIDELWLRWQTDYGLVFDLFLPSIITGLAMAAVGGSVGVITLLRREALLALALPQVVLLGVAVGLRYLALDPTVDPSPTTQWLVDHTGWPTLPGAVMAVAVALLLAAAARTRRGEISTTSPAALGLLPALYVGATSAAVLVVYGAGNDLADLTNRFVGIEIAVDAHLAEVSVSVLLVCGVAVTMLWRRWLLLSQAPAIAQIARLRPAAWDALFLALLSAVILIGTNALGVVMVLATLFLPAATVIPWCRRVPTAMVAAALLSVTTYAAGFLISNSPDFYWPLSHTVGALGIVLFMLSYLSSLLRR